jgi:hypothetical protein
MNPKKTPFTEAYVKDQQSNLSLGYRLFLAMGVVLVLSGAILAFLRPQSVPVQGLNTLHKDKDVAGRQ